MGTIRREAPPGVALEKSVVRVIQSLYASQQARKKRMRQAIKRTITVHINCDCAAYDIEVRPDVPDRWMYGPRCRECGRIMGPLQWNIADADRCLLPKRSCQD